MSVMEPIIRIKIGNVIIASANGEEATCLAPFLCTSDLLFY